MDRSQASAQKQSKTLSAWEKGEAAWDIVWVVETQGLSGWHDAWQGLAANV